MTDHITTDAQAPGALIEACAKIAEPWAGFWLDKSSTDADRAVVAVRTEIAAKIRALIPDAAQAVGMREALIAAREYIEPDTHVPWADRLLAQIDAALAAQPPAAPVDTRDAADVLGDAHDHCDAPRPSSSAATEHELIDRLLTYADNCKADGMAQAEADLRAACDCIIGCKSAINVLKGRLRDVPQQVKVPDLSGTCLSSTGLLVIIDCADFDNRDAIYDWLEALSSPLSRPELGSGK